MEEGTVSLFFPILVMVGLVAVGWMFGQMFPWRRLRHPFGRVSGDGGIEYTLYDVDYTITRDKSKRAKVELKGHYFDFEANNEQVSVSAAAFSPSPITDEMHRIHNAGAMICLLKPAEKRSKRKNNGGDRPPISVDSTKD